jgi:MFS family permease
MRIARRLALGRLISLTGRLGRVHRADRSCLRRDRIGRLGLRRVVRGRDRDRRRVIALALAGMALAGALGGIGDVAATTLMQSRSGDEVRSRVFAAQDGAAHVAYTVAALAGGLIVGLVSARGAFACAAACAGAAALVAVRLSTETEAVGNPVEKDLGRHDLRGRPDQPREPRDGRHRVHL